jgi:hypothetical protein
MAVRFKKDAHPKVPPTRYDMIPVEQYDSNECCNSAIFLAKYTGSITMPTRTSDIARPYRSLVHGLLSCGDRYKEIIKRMFKTIVGRISMASNEHAMI